MKDVLGLTVLGASQLRENYRQITNEPIPKIVTYTAIAVYVTIF